MLENEKKKLEMRNSETAKRVWGVWEFRGRRRGSGSTSLPCKIRKQKRKRLQRSPLFGRGSAWNCYYLRFPPFTITCDSMRKIGILGLCFLLYFALFCFVLFCCVCVCVWRKKERGWRYLNKLIDRERWR